MSFALTDNVGVTIYVIARDVEAAEEAARDYWEDFSEDREHSHDRVHLQRDAAESKLIDRSSPYDPGQDHVYNVRLQFHLAKKYVVTNPLDEGEAAAKIAALLADD